MISNPPKGNSDKEIGANFAPLSVVAQQTPNGTVAVRAGSYLTAAGGHKEFIGGNVSLTTTPGQNDWALVYLASNGALSVTQQIATLGLPVPNEGELALAAVYIMATTATITNDIIYDVRPLFTAQAEIVSGGIQVALDDKQSAGQVDNKLLNYAFDHGTEDAIFELGVGNPASNIDLVAKDGTIRYTGTEWQISNDGDDFSAIGITVANYATIAGAPRDDADLDAELDLKLDVTSFTGHTHVEADITDLQSYLLNVTGESIRTMVDVEGATAATEDQVLAWDDTANLWTPRDRTVDNKATWGNITGTLSGQTDLQTALDAKTTKISNPGAGNLVKVDALGVLLDSGVKDTDFEPVDAAIQTHITAVTGNPHAVTASQVSLGNVTNESKATMFTSPIFTGLPQLPTTAKAALALGAGQAAEPIGSVVFVTDDADSPVFIMAWVDGTTTWVRSDDGTPII